MSSQMRQRALVTGASRGIGLAVARTLTQADGLDVYGMQRSDESAVGVTSLFCDLADPQETARVADELLLAVDRVDILILNAGIGIFAPVDELSLEQWQEVLGVSLTASYILLNRLLPAMKSNNFGRVVFISSDADTLTFAEAGAYCAAKAGLAALAGCVRKEVAGYDIHITVVSPGRVDSHFNHKQPGDRPDALHADDVARQVMFAISQPARCEVERIAVNSAMEKMLH
jgi:3-oxoacyl-[acyl-carrier protein] reductase